MKTIKLIATRHPEVSRYFLLRAKGATRKDEYLLTGGAVSDALSSPTFKPGETREIYIQVGRKVQR